MTNYKLLLRCLDADDDQFSTEVLNQLSTSDWSDIVAVAARNGIIALLCNRLSAFGQDTCIPVDALREVRENYLISSWRNTQHYHELGIILKSMHEHKIPVIVLKGVALAESLYKNIALRPMSDVDLMVRSEDVWKADEVLSEKYRNRSDPILRRHVETLRHMDYANERIRIQLHFRIPELPGLNVWEKAIPATVAAAKALVLGLEDFFLHLCVHLDKHQLSGSFKLLWWYDIKVFLERYSEEINWNYTIETSKAHGVEGNVRRILYMLREHLNVCVPWDVLNQLRDDGISISIDDMLGFRQLPALVNSESGSSGSFISRMPRFRDKIRFIFRLIFPCKSYMVRHYPVSRPGRIYLYYLVSLGEVVTRSVKNLSQPPECPYSLRALFRRLYRQKMK